MALVSVRGTSHGQTTPAVIEPPTNPSLHPIGEFDLDVFLFVFGGIPITIIS